jgi:hypothetical protein
MFLQYLAALNCVNKDNASALAISSTSIRRHGLTLSEYLQTKTKTILQKVASVSVMFDEASDIQMHKHLNVFVNVSTYTISCACLYILYALFILALHVGTFGGNGRGQNVHAGS